MLLPSPVFISALPTHPFRKRQRTVRRRGWNGAYRASNLAHSTIHRCQRGYVVLGCFLRMRL